MIGHRVGRRIERGVLLIVHRVTVDRTRALARQAYRSLLERVIATATTDIHAVR